jgi:U2-associated protein SR140
LAVTNPDKKKEGKGEQQTAGTEEASAAASENTDASAATLVGLYVVSDILSSSSTSSVRHAWRYRQLLETALRSRKVFERLGMMAEKLGWGRLRAEKWKRSVTLVLNLWEGWCVFPVESHALFVSAFENPPSLKAQEKVDDSSKKGKWKVVEANQTAPTTSEPAITGDAEVPVQQQQEEAEEEALGEPIEEDDVDGEPLADEDLDGKPIEDDDDDVIGEPMDEDDDDEDASDAGKGNGPEQPGADDAKPNDTPNDGETDVQAESHSTSRGQPRRRMRAADMFADSDNSDGN